MNQLPYLVVDLIDYLVVRFELTQRPFEVRRVGDICEDERIQVHCGRVSPYGQRIRLSPPIIIPAHKNQVQAHI